MITFKRILAVLLCVILTLSVAPISDFGLYANASTNGITQSQAVAWANSKANAGASLDYDGAHGAQCVDLIKYYYSYLGVTPVTGDGCDYATNALPSGWSRIQYYSGFVPQPGDIAVWTYTTSAHGHVAIVNSATPSTMNVVEQNGSTGITRSHSYSYSYGNFWGVIRPDFANYTSAPTSLVVKIDKYAVNIDESFTITCSANNANRYWIGFYIDNVLVKDTTTYSGTDTVSLTKPGMYSVVVSAINSLGEIYAYSNVVVGDASKYIPETPNVTLSDSVVDVGEQLEVSFSANKAEEYWVGFYRNGTLIKDVSTTSNKYVISFDEPDDYSVTVTAINKYGSSYKNTWFVVDASEHMPEIPNVTLSDSVVDVGEQLEVSFAANKAEEYWVGFYKNGTLIKDVSTKSNKYVISFDEPDDYSVTVTAINEYGSSYKNIWFVVGKYEVLYNTNGGSGAPTSQTKVYGTALTLSSTKPTRTGYTFTGWNTKAGGSGISYAAGASYTANAAITLYAQWTANTNTKYVVNHYQMNISGSGYTLKETENKTGTTASSVTVANLKKSYTGFTYEGGKGATAATATKPSTLDTTTTVLADGTRVINLYYSRNKYALTLNKGTGISTVTGGGTYYYGQSVTIDATVSTGYTWLKWSDNNTTKNATLTMPANALTLTANATLNTYTISYTLNGGNVSTANPTSYNVTTAAFTLNNPTRTGYTFAGWTGTGLSTATKTVTVAKGSTGNRAYNATWTANTYTVTFDANGGTTATANKTVTYDSTYGTLPVPTRTGYTFKGWYIAKTGGTKITADTKVNITSGQTLYAQWTANTYTIAFNANNGSGTMSNLGMTYGVSKTLTANAFTRTGYTFNGWNTKADGSGTTYTDKASVNNLTSTNGATVTLYAQWKINTFTVSYNANGGNSAPSAQTKTYGKALTLSSAQPTRTDYNFISWNTKADGTGVSYQPGDKYTDNKAVTLYAIWELAHKHVYTSSVTKQPTCTEKGIKKFTCSSCGDTYTEDIAALGHNHIGSVTEPTCTEQGYTTYICSRCNDSYIDNYTNSLNHPSSTWHTAVNPTPASNGLAEKRCDYCNHVLEQFVIPNLNPDYVTGISLSSQKETVEIGDVFTLTANIIPDTAKNKNIIWSSRNPDIVTVDSGVVRAVKPGTTAIVAESEDGGYIDFCLVRVVGLVAINGAVIDNDSNIIYGLTCNLNSVDDYLEPVDNNMSISLSTATVGTGTTISIIDNGEVIDSYEAIIFGDVNGDGWYDGEDAFLVNLIVAGLLTEDKLPDYMWTAADCNHDGVIDEVDVDLLMGAGVRRNDIDQNATQAELATQTAYIEYASLIDQSAGMYPDIAPIPDMDGIPEDTTIPETNETVEPDGPVSEDHMDFEVIFTNIFEFIKKILSLIFSFII